MDEYTKLDGNETGRMTANKIKKHRLDEWDKKQKENLFPHHASRTGVHLRASHKYVMIQSTKPTLSHEAKRKNIKLRKRERRERFIDRAGQGEREREREKVTNSCTLS